MNVENNIIYIRRNLLKLKESIDRINDAILVLDNDFNIIFVNKFAYQVILVRSKEIIGKNLFSEVPELSNTKFSRALREAVSTETFTFIEEFLSFNDKWISSRFYPSDSGVSIVIQDITAVKNAERALLMSENRYKSLVESIPIGILLIDNDQFAHYVNKRFVEQTQYSLKDISSIEEFWLLVYPEKESREKIKKEWNDLVDEAIALKKEVVPLECKLRCKNGTYKYFDIGYFNAGDFGIVTFVDVTNRKNAEKEIAESELMYRTITENMTDLIWTMNSKLYMTYVSPSVYKILGYDAKEFLNSPYESNISETSIFEATKIWEQLSESLKKNIDKHKIWTLETEVIRGDSKKIWLITRAKFILDENENIIGVIGTSSDITELKNYNLKLKEQMNELQRWHNATLGRELRIIELKKEVNALLEKLERPHKYKTFELEDEE